MMAMRAKAHAIVDPIKLRIKEAIAGAGGSSRLLRMIQHFRKRVHAAR
jgi:protein involved in polysaccharide export with SLBB domain